MNINDAVEEASSGETYRTAVHEKGKEVDYSDLLTRINKLSHYYSREVTPESRVALISENSSNFITSFFALSKVGPLMIPLDPDTDDDDIANCIKSTGVTHVAVSKTLKDRIRMTLRNHWLSEMPILEVDGISLDEFEPTFKHKHFQKPRSKDPALLLRTRGTVKYPRFAVITHQQLERNVYSLKKPYGLKNNDRVFTSIHWSHPFGLTHGMLLPILNGCTCVIDPKDDSSKMVGFLSRTHITRMADKPRFFFDLLVACKNERYTLPDIKSITVGMGTLSAPLRKAFGLLKIPAAHCYGQTEHVWTIAMENVEEANMMGSLLMKGLEGANYRVVDSKGEEIRAGSKKDGFLAVSSPSIMDGYEKLRIDAKTKDELKMKMQQQVGTETVKQGKWLLTEDAVRLEGGQFNPDITFLGRKEDCHVARNQISSPYAIDAVLKAHEEIIDAVGFSVRIKDGSHVLGCAVIKQEESNLNEGGVIDRLRKMLPPNYLPKLIRFVRSIPRDEGGNPLRFYFSRRYDGVTP